MPSASVGWAWMVAARSPGAAASSMARTPSAMRSEAWGPTMCTPTMASRSRSTTSWVNPSRVPMVAARPRAVIGTVTALADRPASRALSSVWPALATSGSEKTTRGMAAGSNADRFPHTASAATMPSAVPLWASIGAELGVGGGQFDADVAGAHDDHAFRHRSQGQRPGGVDHPLPVHRRHRDGGRPGPRGQDGVAEFEEDRGAVGLLDRDTTAAGEAGHP